ncbi:MAG: TIGR04552 family protein [Candidatus Sericytochromatia bacterium]
MEQEENNKNIEMITLFGDTTTNVDDNFIKNASTFLKYDFAWDIIDVMIGGKSSIDLQRLTISSFEEADQFLVTYGYDLEKPAIRAEINYIFQEAIMFLEEMLIPDPFTKISYLTIPSEIKKEADLRNLLLIASDMDNPNQPWACAVLRIMHTISHVNNDISLKFFPEIQKQILTKIWEAVYIDENGDKYFGEDETGIKVFDIDIKAKKERTSTILKLLHKIENVAADVFDQIGVRIITHDKVDALLIVKHLEKKGIINFCNVKPSRSMNKLLDTKIFRKILNHYKEQLQNGEITLPEFEFLLREEAEKEASLTESNYNINPHTSKEYKSIQFTCRQMIRMEYPIGDTGIMEPFCFFFPYELQVVDVETHHENRFGKASHEKYKEKQLIVARQRVLGKLIRNNLKQI